MESIGGASNYTFPSAVRINGYSILVIFGGETVNGYSAIVPYPTSTASYRTENVLFDFETSGVMPLTKANYGFKEFGLYTVNTSPIGRGQCIAGNFYSGWQLIRYNSR